MCLQVWVCAGAEQSFGQAQVAVQAMLDAHVQSGAAHLRRWVHRWAGDRVVMWVYVRMLYGPLIERE